MPEVRSHPITVIGDINADLTFVLPFFPAVGSDVPADDLRWNSGGTGLNMALTLARLGAYPLLVGRVGSDPSAAVALRMAQGAGINLAALQSDPTHPTGLCGVMVDPSGQRTFLSYRGANVFCDPAQLPAAEIAASELLIIGGHALLEEPQRQAVLHAIEIAVSANLPITLDVSLPAARLVRRLIMGLLPQIHLLCMNEDELRTLLPQLGINEAIAFLLAAGVQHVAVKRGAQGCVVANGDLRLNVLPPAVTVVDTNGCGDAFTAAYAWALRRGADISNAAVLANLLGALTATRIGAADAIPDSAAISARLDHSLHHLLG